MARFNRRISPKVISGAVQERNRTAPTPTYWNTDQKVPVIDKERPGRGYRHLLRKKDIFDFIEILPHWDDLAVGLNAVLLAEGEEGLYGWYDTGVVGVCAWPRDLWTKESRDYYDMHKGLYARLGVPSEPRGELILWKHTEATARAFQLLRVFLHELGHHHDRMTTRSKIASTRGEDFAENYAIRYEDMIWDRYIAKFGLD